jgi:hypothetical protein
MKKNILNLTIAVLLTMGTCFAQEQEAIQEPITEEQAIEIATMAWGKEVTEDTVIEAKATEKGYWEVTFKSAENPVGGRMIRVDEKTGESTSHLVK